MELTPFEMATYLLQVMVNMVAIFIMTFLGIAGLLALFLCATN